MMLLLGITIIFRRQISVIELIERNIFLNSDSTFQKMTNASFNMRKKGSESLLACCIYLAISRHTKTREKFQGSAIFLKS